MKVTRKGTLTRKRSTSDKTTDAIKIIDRITGTDPKLRKAIDRAVVNAEIAEMLYEARTSAGLTQRELAELAGTRQPVIARLEDADYRGHSLTMLQRIAAALDRRLVVGFAPTVGERQN